MSDFDDLPQDIQDDIEKDRIKNSLEYEDILPQDIQDDIEKDRIKNSLEYEDILPQDIQDDIEKDRIDKLIKLSKLKEKKVNNIYLPLIFTTILLGYTFFPIKQGY